MGTILPLLCCLSEEDNLWLACSLCNSHKGERVTSLDPVTGDIVRLFDPRRQVWQAHFAWTRECDCPEPESSCVGAFPSAVEQRWLAPASRVAKPYGIEHLLAQALERRLAALLRAEDVALL